MLETIKLHTIYKVIRFFPFAFFLLNFTIPLLGIESEISKKVNWPLEMRLPISGSFAEYRNSHLHMGCDFKTYGINGFPVLSVFDGFVSTMSYSEFGYGLSIILSSPSLNLNARYAHLNDLNGDATGLEELNHSLRLLGNPAGYNVKLKPEMVAVKSKSKIARSGETGSGVSHLHLELFDSKGYYNPLNFPDFVQNDITPPVIQSIFIDSDSGITHSLVLKKKIEGEYEVEVPSIKTNGKIKIRVAGYDFMTSRNRNNVYRIALKNNQKVIFEKVLDQMSHKDASHRENLYDINKSSLSPAVYVYNLFTQSNTSFSYDLSDLAEAQKINLRVELADASGNISFVNLPIEINHSEIKTDKVSRKEFNSEDGTLTLDYSGLQIVGDGTIEIKKLNKIPEEYNFPGFLQISDAYEIKAINFSWKGEAKGLLKGNFPNKDDDIYIFDTAFKQWVGLSSKRNQKHIQFSLTRLGIIAIMKDKTPPVINYPYLVNRDFNLPEVKDPRMLEKFYAIYDRGSGVSGEMKVLFEGSPYPFEYDKDRGFIKLEIPLILKKYNKSFYIIQIQIQDKAGNKSNWFTDVVSL
jgi:hypothetical protein